MSLASPLIFSSRRRANTGLNDHAVRVSNHTELNEEAQDSQRGGAGMLSSLVRELELEQGDSGHAAWLGKQNSGYHEHKEVGQKRLELGMVSR